MRPPLPTPHHTNAGDPGDLAASAYPPRQPAGQVGGTGPAPLIRPHTCAPTPDSSASARPCPARAVPPLTPATAPSRSCGAAGRAERSGARGERAGAAAGGRRAGPGDGCGRAPLPASPGRRSQRPPPSPAPWRTRGRSRRQLQWVRVGVGGRGRGRRLRGLCRVSDHRARGGRSPCAAPQFPPSEPLPQGRSRPAGSRVGAGAWQGEWEVSAGPAVRLRPGAGRAGGEVRGPRGPGWARGARGQSPGVSGCTPGRASPPPRPQVLPGLRTPGIRCSSPVAVGGPCGLGRAGGGG